MSEEEFKVNPDWVPYLRGTERTAPDSSPFGPYQGAANWSDLWTDWTSVGNDYTLVGTEEYPLDERQSTQLENIVSYVGQYVIDNFVEKLGEGQMGHVWRVRCRKRLPDDPKVPGVERWENIEAACKVIRPQHDTESDQEDMIATIEHMLHDMYALRRLQHKNIVQMLDVIIFHDTETRFPFSTLLLLMELCDGTLIDLSHTFDPKALPLYLAKKFMADVSAGLQHMHALNMVHLDIKPENVVFQWGSRPELDLGSCLIFGADQPSVTTVYTGTTAYNPPEMEAINDQPELKPIETKPCDIYSLGMTLAFCLIPYDTFDPIQESGNVQQYLKQMIDSNTYIEDLNETVIRLIDSMIDKEWSNRPNINQVLSNEWLSSSPKSKSKTFQYRSSIAGKRKRRHH